MSVDEQAMDAFHKTAWREIYRQIDLFVSGLRDGVGPEMANPFDPSGKSNAPVPKSVLSLRESLVPTGLHEDPDFLRHLEEALRYSMSSTMFAMMTAFDGEGRFEGGANLSIVTDSGDEVSGYLHETFGSADPRQDGTE